jgi:hypothetical protein
VGWLNSQPTPSFRHCEKRLGGEMPANANAYVLCSAGATKQSFEVENPVYSFAVECLRIFNLKLHQITGESFTQSFYKNLAT